MSVRVYPGDQITVGMHFGGNVKRMEEMRAILAQSFGQFEFNLIDIYTMFPTVLWVQPPDKPTPPCPYVHVSGDSPQRVIDGEVADES